MWFLFFKQKPPSRYKRISAYIVRADFRGATLLFRQLTDSYRLRRLTADIDYPMITGDSGPPLYAEAILPFGDFGPIPLVAGPKYGCCSYYEQTSLKMRLPNRYLKVNGPKETGRDLAGLPHSNRHILVMLTPPRRHWTDPQRNDPDNRKYGASRIPCTPFSGNYCCHSDSPERNHYARSTCA